MNIVVGDDNLKLIDEKYTVLPLDSFRYNQTVKTAYAVLENIPIQEMNQIDYYKRLHIDLIKFYQGIAAPHRSAGVHLAAACGYFRSQRSGANGRCDKNSSRRAAFFGPPM